MTPCRACSGPGRRRCAVLRVSEGHQPAAGVCALPAAASEIPGALCCKRWGCKGWGLLQLKGRGPASWRSCHHSPCLTFTSLASRSTRLWKPLMRVWAGLGVSPLAVSVTDHKPGTTSQEYLDFVNLRKALPTFLSLCYHFFAPCRATIRSTSALLTARATRRVERRASTVARMASRTCGTPPSFVRWRVDWMFALFVFTCPMCLLIQWVGHVREAVFAQPMERSCTCARGERPYSEQTGHVLHRLVFPCAGGWVG